MIKIAHESMLSVHPLVTSLTDYDYFLVHLLELNENYRKLAENCDRMSILDNSIFELGVSYDPDKYRYWINRIKPTIAVIPDVLNDMQKTLSQMDEWFSNKSPSVKYMAVVQGGTEEELFECWYTLLAEPGVDFIGISFDSRPFEIRGLSGTLDEALMQGRMRFLDGITNKGKEVPSKPIHLLGCALPQEMKHYRDRYADGIIYSVDTSSPVVHGFYGVPLSNEGLEVKIKVKLDSLIDEPVSPRQVFKIDKNIKCFRRFTNK